MTEPEDGIRESPLSLDHIETVSSKKTCEWVACSRSSTIVPRS